MSIGMISLIIYLIVTLLCLVSLWTLAHSVKKWAKANGHYKGQPLAAMGLWLMCFAPLVHIIFWYHVYVHADELFEIACEQLEFYNL